MAQVHAFYIFQSCNCLCKFWCRSDIDCQGGLKLLHLLVLFEQQLVLNRWDKRALDFHVCELQCNRVECKNSALNYNEIRKNLELDDTMVLNLIITRKSPCIHHKRLVENLRKRMKIHETLLSNCETT